MKLGLQFRERLQAVPGLTEELDQLVEAIRTSYLIEHDADGRFRQVTVDARLLTAQTLTTGVVTRVLVGRPARTTGPIDLDTATGIVTIRTPGIYQVIGQVRFATSAAGHRDVALFQRLTQIAKCQLPPVTVVGNVTIMQVCATVPCVSGDTLSLQAAHSVGANLDLEVSDTFLSVTRVG